MNAPRLDTPRDHAPTGTACGTGDRDGNDSTSPAPMAPFVQALLNPTPATRCPGDTNHDNSLNGNDIQWIVAKLTT